MHKVANESSLTARTSLRTLALEGVQLKTITATDARKKLYRLLDEVSVTSDPIQITGRRSSAILVSEDDWRAIKETIHLLSIPGMRESIREGLKTDLESCIEELDW